MPLTPAQQIAGLARRKARFDTRLQWFGERVARNIRIGMTTRLRLAAQLLRDKTVINISRPVTKTPGVPTRARRRDPISPFAQPKTFTRVTNRSVAGEFPKSDSTLLMKTTFWQMINDETAMIGTPLHYGLILETRMNRSFLVRTHREFMPTFRRIMLSGPRLPGQDIR